MKVSPCSRSSWSSAKTHRIILEAFVLIASDGRLRSKKRRPADAERLNETQCSYAALLSLAEFFLTVCFCFATCFACLAANSASTVLRTFATSTPCCLVAAMSVSSCEADSKLPSKAISTMNLERPFSSSCRKSRARPFCTYG